MNENLQLAEIVYKALRDNKIPVGCAALGIIKSALEHDQLQAAPGQIEKDIATVAKLCTAAPDLLEACHWRKSGSAAETLTAGSFWLNLRRP